ncbi:sensor domain-containing protein [Psychromonas aquimarina]|uniref:sensor domain-containing protein n=1 Tax=Psychromonas aquimarina TaxID=444919 RepID=UPI0004282112|nr:bifunctional diguanylate cyclase/phosphodiesterase [Psychromonas aquimarina]
MLKNHAATILIRYFLILISCYFFYINLSPSLLNRELSNEEVNQIEMIFLLVFSTLFWGYQIFTLQLKRKQSEAFEQHEIKIAEALIQDSSNVLFHLNPAGSITFISALSESILGYNEAELLLRPFSSLFYDAGDFNSISEQSERENLQAHSQQSRLICKNGTIIWAEIRTVSNKSSAGPELQGCIRDISRQQEMLELLQGKEQMLRTIIEHIPYIVFVKNSDDEIIIANKLLCDLLGQTSDEVLGKSAKNIFPHALVNSLSRFTARNSGKPLYIQEIIDPHGEVHEFEFSQFKLSQSISNSSLVIIGKEVSRLEKRAQTIEHFLQYDPLTGLLNRNVFINQLTKYFNNVKEHHSAAVCIVDLYDFKRINNTLGHEIGDLALKYTAQKICMIGDQLSMLCRYNGDEFAFVLHRVNSQQALNKIIKRLHSFFEFPVRLQDVELKLTVNIGIVFSPNEGLSTEALLKKLDIALHAAKSSSSKQTQIYSGELEESLQANMRIEKYLTKALANSELSLVYQPFVSSLDDRLMGAEVLIRWYNDHLGQVYPDQFIPVAEKSGEIVSIGSWVIEQACLQLKIWQKKFGDDFYLAVNVSPRQFLYGDLVNVIDRALAAAGVRPSSLEVEITEGLLLGNQESVLNTMHQLVDRGVRLSLDDFGTGYSSLNYLKKYPFDCLKIDRAFIVDISKDQQGEALVTAITNMAHALKLSVVAEGVEHEEQLAKLRFLEVDIIQGYYYSEPLSSSEFNRWFQHHRPMALNHLS